MTEVSLYSRDGMHILECRGHAGYNPGMDVVCAGISALVCALAGFALDAPEGEARLERGRALIRCRATPRSDTAFELTWRGLRQIELAYPGHVRTFGGPVRAARRHGPDGHQTSDSRERPRYRKESGYAQNHAPRRP